MMLLTQAKPIRRPASRHHTLSPAALKYQGIFPLFRARQAGLTLIELVISILVIGILSIILGPAFSSAVAGKKGQYSEAQKANNQIVGLSLLNYAHDSTMLGTLPAPYTGGGVVSGAYNTGDATASGLALKAALTQSGVNPQEILDDNYPSKRVRVYQLVDGLTQTMPMYFQSGPLVTLTYQFGAIYMTGCAKADTGCNPSASGVPGSSAVMTSANYSTWATAGTDVQPFFISTLSLQKQMLVTTVNRLDKLRDSLLGYLREKQRLTGGADTTNWFLPNPGTMGGQTPGSNQGCRDGWYDLTNDTQIFPSLGLAASEYGVTAWGGKIQYCRDYDPAETHVANAAPHYAALRINSSVSSGSAPDTAVTGNNVVLTF